MSSSHSSIDGRRRPAYGPPLMLQPGEPNPEPKEKEKCPRCESRNTKFCYYNNYNTSQPRHFCRSCRRYWTLGGTLRNVPIGGSSRNTNNNINKRLRPNPNPNPYPFPYQNCFLPPPERYRFELGLGLGAKTWPGPSASMEDMGFGLGSTTLLWPSWLLGESGGVGQGLGSNGPTNGEVL